MNRLLKTFLPWLGRGRLIKYILTGIFSGLCSFLFMNLVTTVLGLVVTGGLGPFKREYFILFAVVIILFIWTRKLLSQAIITLSQQLFWNLRRQIITTVLRGRYTDLAARKSRIQTAVVNDVHVLTEASFGIIHFFTSLVLAVACLAYLATISPGLFGITLGIALLGVGVYMLGSRRDVAGFETSRKLEDEFMGNFNALLNGFKEIYMDPRKGHDLNDTNISAIAGDAQKINTRAYTGFLNNQITGQVLFYVLITSILLFFSNWLGISVTNTVSYIFTLLFLLSSIEAIMVLLPSFVRARISAANLSKLKDELEESPDAAALPPPGAHRFPFESLVAQGLVFTHGHDWQGFAVGPVNMEIERGETVFIYGGNGSGKTTFVHTLIGLLNPQQGAVLLNGQPVTEAGMAGYKCLFAVVFSDFYLFTELFGTKEVNQTLWDEYLDLFELRGKVQLTGRKYSTTDLSAGQRKRLALISALMEEKPILVLDEWAADQDPFFRKKFYMQIIPFIKNRGITVIAVTHDDKYYHCAERLFKMEEGRLTEIRSLAGAGV